MRTLLVALVVLTPSGLTAQLVRGRIIEKGTERAILYATIALLDDRDRVRVEGEADSLGTFRIRAWEAGKYRLQVIALGYETVTSDLLELGTGQEFVLTVNLAVDAVALDAIVVVSRSTSSLKDIALRGYYDRRDTGRRIGMGRFLDRGELEERGTTRLTDVLMKVPGLRLLRDGACTFIAVSGNPAPRLQGTASGGGSRGAGGTCQVPKNVCPASVYLDGIFLKYDDGSVPIDQMVPLAWVEAIEVYRRASEMPAEFLGSGACGVIAVWTRRG